ncbi:PRELI-like family-domain-containing protein [Catenaria anguillulae PL171]|uniref:PRELI-like family-domain-containing protein n=1 Tax=Catenaria anguillulae PL171 TaxID=765915 RepID=A0A1Y2H4J6_9FUNG|nr:PRELI-like family-domain-containing protein [Catenaria anguillulae PL171]
MKLHSSEHHYDHPWSAITAAVWQKYPNHLTPHVISVDVLSRHVDQATQTLRTERLLTIRQSIPTFILRLFNMSEPLSHVLEVSEINLATQTCRAVSTNLTCREFMTMDETVTYRPDPADREGRTVMVQEAQVSSSVSRFSSYCEDLLINRFRENAKVGRDAMREVVERIVAEVEFGVEKLGVELGVGAMCEGEGAVAASKAPGK